MSLANNESMEFSIQTNPHHAKSLSWPYACFGFGSDHFWLYCAFKELTLNRIELPKQEGNYTIEKMNITFDLDLFLVLTSYSMRKYQLWKYDLKQDSDGILLSKIVNEKCFEYSFDQA
jgi:hypothetical protein